MSFARHWLIMPALLALLMGDAALAQRRGDGSPEPQTLTTKDGVELHVTYYPSSVGRNAAPVVILPDFKETRRTYSSLARRLAQPTEERDKHKPFAVVTVDVRGHGESIRQTVGGRTRELSAAELRPGDFREMVLNDMETVRKFLVDKNDAGELNLSRLSVVGIGMGATVGINWTARDWAMPPLATGKQGQDVRTLIAVSPRWKTNGLSVQQALRQPGLRKEVAVLLLYGEGDRRVSRDVERIYSQLERDRDEPRTAPGVLRDLMKANIDSELQGGNLLRQAGAKGEQLIIDYLVKFSVEPDYPWRRRRRL